MTYETRVFAQTSSGSSAEDVSTAELRCVASTPPGSRPGLPSYKRTGKLAGSGSTEELS